jgi:hypothetical protein
LYTRSNTKHFDAHTDETSFLFDDYNQMDDLKAKEIFDLCSGTPQILPKADVESKGTSILPRVIFTTSNSPSILKTSKVASLEAFERRRTHLFETRIDPSFCPLHNTMPSFMSCGLTTCGSVATASSIQYRPKPSFSRMWKNPIETEWFSLSVLIPTLVKIIKDNENIEEIKIDDNFRNVYCDMNLAKTLPKFDSVSNFEEPTTNIDVSVPGFNVNGEDVHFTFNTQTLERKRRNILQGFRILSQNLNGFKDAKIDFLLDHLNNNEYDILCFQEVSKSQSKQLQSLDGYIKFVTTMEGVNLVTMVLDVWKCSRVSPAIICKRTVLSISFSDFVLSNVHFSPNEDIFYPLDDNHIICGDVNGNIPDLFHSNNDNLPTYQNKVYDIISSTYDAFTCGNVLGEFQSDHCAMTAVVGALKAQGCSLSFVEIYENFTNIKFKTSIAFLLQVIKQKEGIFSYIWEDFAMAGIQEVLSASDSEILNNPAFTNIIFALYEFVIYYKNNKSAYMDKYQISTLTFLLKRVQAFAMHVTQDTNLFERITRHVQYNGENWESKSNFVYLLTIVKYAINANFTDLISLQEKFCCWIPSYIDNVSLKSFTINDFTFNKNMFSAAYAKAFAICNASLSDISTWISLQTVAGFKDKFLTICISAKNTLYQLCDQMKSLALTFKEYIFDFVRKHPIITSGGLMCFMAAAYMVYKRITPTSAPSDARVLSYDDMYNVFKISDPVEPDSFTTPTRRDDPVEPIKVVQDEDDYDFIGAYDDAAHVETIRKSKKVSEGVDVRMSEQILPAIRSNMCSIVCNGYKMGALFVGGTTCILPKHFLTGAKTNGKEEVTFYMGMEPIKVIVDFSDPNVCVKCKNSDIMFIHLACNRISPKRNIASHFLPNSMLKNIAREEIIMSTRNCVERSNMFVERIAMATRELGVNYSLDGERIICGLGLKYRMDTSPGDCGSVILLTNARYNSKLYGFHVAGSRKTKLGYGQAISSEVVLSALKYFNDRSTPPDVIANGFIDSSDISSVSKARVIPGSYKDSVGNFTYVGTLPLNKVPYSPSKTDLRKTQIYEEIVPSVKAPAILKPVKRGDIYIHPMKASLDKYSTPLEPFDPAILKRIENFLINKYKLLAQSQNCNFSLYTEEENILGREDGLGKIPHNTSVGYPYTLQKLNKKDIFDYDQGIIIHEPFCNDVKRTEIVMQNLTHSGQVWTDCLKDEKRSLDKIEQVKTRTFAIPSVVTTFITRKYYGAAVDFFTKMKIITPYSVGINAEGPEWTELFNKHNNHSPNIIAGDYSKYDGTSPPELVAMFARIVNALYDDEHSNIREQICNELTHTLQLSENLLYFTHQGIPSGSPLTVYVNSAINEILMMYAYLVIGKSEGIALDSWESNVKLSTYGDDNLLSVSHDIKHWYHFNNISECFGELGLKYTPEDKKSGGFLFKSIYDISFLKRKFVRDKEYNNRILAPIDMESINELFNWYRTGMNEEEILYVNIEDAMRKAHAWGKQYFDALLQKTNKVLFEHELAPVYSTWDELNYLWVEQFN